MPSSDGNLPVSFRRFTDFLLLLLFAGVPVTVLSFLASYLRVLLHDP